MRSRKRSRNGAILIVALVAVAIFTSLSVTNIRSILQHRQTVKSERDLIQAQLMCDAGCDRAATRFAADRNYQGEVWIDSQDPATGVTMKVTVEVLLKQNRKIANVQASIEGRSNLPAKIQRSRLIALDESP